MVSKVVGSVGLLLVIVGKRDAEVLCEFSGRLSGHIPRTTLLPTTCIVTHRDHRAAHF